ncbi:MAG: redoxin domain-containing protein [Thermoguttaceae bacterium]
MGKSLMRLRATVLAVAALILAGCPARQEAEPAPPAPPAAPQTSAPEEPAPKQPIPIEMAETLKTLEAAPTAIPQVQLPQSLKETCLVTVGDPLPDGEVLTLEGEKKAVADLLGTKGTVVFFWGVGGSENAEKIAVQALADLEGDAIAAYGDQGLAVVAISPNAPAEEPKDGRGTVDHVSANIGSRLEMSKRVKQLLGTMKISYPVMLDPGGTYFAKVATARLPRVYVLDAAGKIAWFDVGFSETSREDLKRTLEFMFGGSEPANP